MKIYGLIFLILLMLSGCKHSERVSDYSTDGGSLLESGALFHPNSGSLVPIQGRSFEASDFTGVPVSLFFWNTSGCMSSCNTAFEALSRRDRTVGIFIGDSGSEILPLDSSSLMAHDIHGEYWKAVGAKKFPTVLMLNSKQQVLRVLEGNEEIQKYLKQNTPQINKIEQLRYYLGFQSGSTYQGSTYREKDSLGAFSFGNDIKGIGFDLSGGWFVSNDVIIAAKKSMLRIHATGTGLTLGLQRDKTQRITVFLDGEKLHPGDTPQRLDENGSMYIRESGAIQIFPNTKYLSGAFVDVHADTGLGIEYFEFK